MTTQIFVSSDCKILDGEYAFDNISKDFFFFFFKL